MTLENCTKEELIYIIKQLSFNRDCQLKWLLFDVNNNREKNKLKEAAHWHEIEREARNKYNEFAKKYNGTPIVKIPRNELEEAAKVLETAEEAERKWLALVGLKL